VLPISKRHQEDKVFFDEQGGKDYHQKLLIQFFGQEFVVY